MWIFSLIYRYHNRMDELNTTPIYLKFPYQIRSTQGVIIVEKYTRSFKVLWLVKKWKILYSSNLRSDINKWVSAKIDSRFIIGKADPFIT